MAGHSKIVGGSSADRLINCPGSYALKLKLPDDDTTSSYAEEGTAMHEAMEYLLGEAEPGTDPNDLIGMVFNTYEITTEYVADLIRPALEAFDHFDGLCVHEGSLEYLLEQHVEVQGLPVDGVFGTSDLVGRTKRRTVIWDWKFGSKKVEAKNNAQGMFYALGAYDTAPHMFGDGDDWPVDIVICQPKSYGEDDGPCYDRWTTTVGDLKAFRKVLADAITKAMSPEAERLLKRGKHCDFQNCRSICPLHLAPLSGLLEIAEPISVHTETIATHEAGGQVALAEIETAEEYLADYYGRALDLFEFIEPLMKEIRVQAQARLEAGKPVIGYKLVPKRATRKYVDEKKARAFYTRRLKLSVGEITEQVLLSPAQVEKVLKAKGIKLGDDDVKRMREIAPSISSGDTLAPWDDPRRAVTSVAEARELLAANLKAL